MNSLLLGLITAIAAAFAVSTVVATLASVIQIRKRSRESQSETSPYEPKAEGKSTIRRPVAH